MLRPYGGRTVGFRQIGQSLFEGILDGGADAAFEIFVGGFFKGAVGGQLGILSFGLGGHGMPCPYWSQRFGLGRESWRRRRLDLFQRAEAGKHHFTEGGRIFAQHALREGGASGADFLGGLPCSAEKRSVDLFEGPSAFSSCPRLVGTPDSGEVSLPFVARLDDAVPELAGFVAAPWIFHLRREPGRRLG